MDNQTKRTIHKSLGTPNPYTSSFKKVPSKEIYRIKRFNDSSTKNYSPHAKQIKSGSLSKSRSSSGLRARNERLTPKGPSSGIWRNSSNLRFEALQYTGTNLEASFQLKKRSTRSKINASPKGFEENEVSKLHKELKSKLEKASNFSNFEVIKIYSSAFEKVIEKDKGFGALLKKIKQAYDKLIFSEDQTKFKDTLELLNEERSKILSLREEVKKLKLEIKNSNYVIENYKQAILTDNPKENLVANMEQEIKAWKEREMKYLKFLSVLKSKGYPIEETFRELKSRNPSKVPNIQSLNESTNCAESKVPQLSLPNNTGPGFHEEFLSKAPEFSKSWRKQLEKESVK